VENKFPFTGYWQSLPDDFSQEQIESFSKISNEPKPRSELAQALPELIKAMEENG